MAASVADACADEAAAAADEADTDADDEVPAIEAVADAEDEPPARVLSVRVENGEAGGEMSCMGSSPCVFHTEDPKRVRLLMLPPLAVLR